MDTGLPVNFCPETHDALVLIHPTQLKDRRPKDYPYRLLDAVDSALESGKPVFLLPDGGRFKWLSRQLLMRPLVRIPHYLHSTRGVKNHVIRRRLQREVDFIAKVLTLPPAEIRLGFAGMYASYCVFRVAQIWCREVVPWWPREVDMQLRSCLPKRPIARGDILSEIVVGIDDNAYVLRCPG
jgi:hypothetical protein